MHLKWLQKNNSRTLEATGVMLIANKISDKIASTALHSHRDTAS